MEGKPAGGANNQNQESQSLTKHPTRRMSKQESSGAVTDHAAVKIESLKRFLKGGASGLLSGALLQPFQVIKTSMQVSVQDQAKFL